LAAGEVTVKPLATNSQQQPAKIHNVELLGHKGKLKWPQMEAGLKGEMPSERPCDHAVTLKVR
jgi:alpha-L-fucosidase